MHSNGQTCRGTRPVYNDSDQGANHLTLEGAGGGGGGGRFVSGKNFFPFFLLLFVAWEAAGYMFFQIFQPPIPLSKVEWFAP